MKPNELKIILDKHVKYLKGEEDGEKADLRGADLSEADLSGADLRWANLRGADLRGADLRGADLVYFTFNRHTAYFTFDNKIRIGCEYLPIEYWKKSYKTIGEKEGYTDIEIKAYLNFINLCEQLQAEHETK